MHYEIPISTTKKEELIDITAQVETILQSHAYTNGAITIFVPHTTAGITINENADPAVKRDILMGLSQFVPKGGYKHLEGNSPAHIKASLMGSSIHLVINNGSCMLGTWQGIYFCEFDGPRKRKVWISMLQPAST